MIKLQERLRGNYTVPVRDGAGPLNGKAEFSRSFPVPPICIEAADALDAAEAEIARLKETNRLLGNELADCKAIEEANISAQPPAVGEDVVERAKAAVMEAYADYWGLSGDELPDNCAVAITDALIRSNLLRTKDAGHKPENS